MMVVYFRGYRDHYRCLVVPVDSGTADWYPNESYWMIPGTLPD